MIIDSHVHLVGNGWVRGKFIKSSSTSHTYKYNRIHGTNLTPSEYLDKHLRRYVDPDGDELVKTMDKAGVDVDVIFSVDWAPFTGEARVSNREVNHHFSEVPKKHPGRFWPLCALDPTRGDALDQATEAIEKWGMKGFKLMPSTGFCPDDPICYPFYEKCAEWGVPIMFHSGGGGVPHWQYSQPMYIASVAFTFPDVKMIMAHAGEDSAGQALHAASTLPNVYLDISVVGQWKYVRNPENFYLWLRNLIDEVGPWKILFATDWPQPDLWISLVDWVKAIKEPKTKLKFTPEEINIILGTAAQKVFGIPDNFCKSSR